VNPNYPRKGRLYIEGNSELALKSYDLNFRYLASHCLKEAFIAVDDKHLLEKTM